MGTPSWTRIELSTRATGPEPGLQARIADPLWMLARQWQLGELRGEDAGSPVAVKVSVQSTPLQGWLPGTAKPTATGPKLQPLSAGTPLEALVERELVTTGPGAFRLAAEAGQHLLRLLDARGLSRHRALLRQAFVLAVPADLAGLEAVEVRRLKLLARTSLDGAAVRTRLRTQSEATLATALSVPVADQPALAELLTGWRAWYDARLVEGEAAASSWRGSRMEYAFQVAAPGAEANVVLKAEGYADGHLDWEDLDVVKDVTLGLKPAATTKTASALPARVRFRGMPARRFWELEDGSIYFGGIEAGTQDLARLVVAEFATVYGDDWFVMPVALAMGALHRVTALTVSDTFGGTTVIPAAAVKDGPARPWRFFELTGDPGPAQGKAPWLLLPPALGEVTEGEELERVVLARDEQANLAWAVEELCESPLGHGSSRRDQTLRAGGKAQGAGGEGTREEWVYRLAQEPPPWWVPLVPVQLKDAPGQYMLRRGRLASWESLPAALRAGARGVLLEPDRALRLFEEEVPPEGVEVTRQWQLARGADGRVLLWVGRRKRTARKQHGSGLRFDALQRGGR